MSYHLDDTISAIGTANGGAARGMVRVSGREAVAIVERVFTPTDGQPLAEVRGPTVVGGNLRIAVRSDCGPANSLQAGSDRESILPCDMFLWPTNRSYTREPVVELHTIGSAPLLQAVLAAVCRAGARLAEPGEFTLRAFLAGRLDLTRAEAVLGVIDAASGDELDTALAQLAGGLARPLHKLREDLLQLLAELEAGLDFVEDDIRFISQREIVDRLMAAAQQLEGVAEQMRTRHTANELDQVVLVGQPNVGKSSLFNAIVKRYGINNPSASTPGAPALVSPYRGTTRDYLTARISLDGIACELIDTAGIDNSFKDAIAIGSIAQSLAADRRRSATVIVGCIEVTAWNDRAADPGSCYDEANCGLIAVTKADLYTPAIRVRDGNLAAGPSCPPMILTSSRTGEGLEEFCGATRRLLSRNSIPHRGRVINATAERCGESIRLAGSAVQMAAGIAEQDAGDELVAAELRVALAELGKVVGAVYTDDLLDRIFKTFCIGK